MKTALALLALAGLASLASAGIGVETYGAAAPPRWMADGRYFMTAPPLRTDLFTDITETPDGTYGVIRFDRPVSIRAIGQGWATWSHGYTGNCFYTNGSTHITMTLSPNTRAFRFYAEPNPFGDFQMTATVSDGGSSIASRQLVDGASGASGWGFYTTDFSAVTSVTVECDVDFAVGEFATAFLTPPAPATPGLFALAALLAARRR